MAIKGHGQLPETNELTGLNCWPLQDVMYGYADPSGDICVVGSVRSDGKPQAFDGLLCAHLYLLELHDCTVLPLSDGKRAVFVADDVLDTSAYLTELLEHLPARLAPVLIVSTSVFPHLLDGDETAARLTSMAFAYYATLEQTVSYLESTRDQWLAVLWATLFAERNSLSAALAGNLWDLQGTAADLLWLHHAIAAKYPSAITWQDLVNCATLAELSQRLHDSCNAPLPRFTSDSPRSAPESLSLSIEVIPLDATWTAIWAQAMLSSEAEPASWHHQRGLRVTLAIDKDYLYRAVKRTLASEPLLRSRFIVQHGQLVQQLYATCPIPITMATVANTVLGDHAALVAQLDTHHTPIHANHFPLWQLVVLQPCSQTHLPVEAIVSLRLHPVLGPACLADQLLMKIWQQYQALDLEVKYMQTIVPCADLPPSTELPRHKLSLQADSTARDDYWLSVLADTPVWLDLPSD
ncbi:hypothetical protein H4R34_005886, partial [Dimargaris verticillata]